MSAARKFPPPWHVVKIPGGHVVVDANGFRLAYIYAREEEMVRADHLSPAEAGKIAGLVSQLPEVWPKSNELKRPGTGGLFRPGR
jgi:hypothetical protein